jgi:uncharacterized membrane protein (DUF441 family)
MEGFWVLMVILFLGIIGKNSTVWIAAGVLLILTLLSMKWQPAHQFLGWLEGKGLSWGIIILTIGILSTIGLGKLGWSDIWNTAKSYLGWVSILVGIFVAYLGGKGANILSTRPDVITGLLIGTIIGVALFRGVPVGPLIAAGILAIFSDWIK